MDTKAIFSYPRHLLSQYKGRILRAGKQMMSPPQPVLFVFGGKAQRWPGMGSELYSTEKVFRDYIQNCDRAIQSLGEKSILPNFEKKADPEFFEDEANLVFVVLSIQMALYELLKSKGVLPNAVMGISLGEISAVYAAGGISLTDALKVAAGGIAMSRQEKKEYNWLYVHRSWADAKESLKKSPTWMPVVYEMNDHGVLVFCHKDEQKIAGDFLNGENIKWHVLSSVPDYPYHTELMMQHEQLTKALGKDIAYTPLQCNYYSSILAAMVPEATILENSFWFRMIRQPVWTHTLLKQMSAADYKTLVHINTPSFSEKDLVRSQSESKEKIQSLYTLLPGHKELDLYKATEVQLLKTKRQASSLLRYSVDELKSFKERVNFYEPQFYKNTLPYLKYLQRNGNVHYLPRQNEWVVLDYANAEYVLKTPEIFSSTVHKTFDEYLLGSDPPSHSFLRSLMQPLFSQQRFNMIAQYTSVKANELLEGLVQKNRSDFVNDFSLPLSQAVIAKFMGLTEEEGIALKNKIKQHPYEMKFFDDLKEFSKEYLERHQAINEDTVGSFLLGLVNKNRISFDTAVSLLRLLWVAGMTTTSMLVSSAILLLSQDPDLLSLVRNDEQTLNKFIEECLRLEAPESEIRRITTKDVRLSGQALPKGAMVVLKLQTINRDPAYFENPESVDLNRSAKKHFSFGGGYHFCIGAGMARIEAKIAIKTVLEKFALLKADQRETEYFPSQHFRGLRKLMILCKEKNTDS